MSRFALLHLALILTLGGCSGTDIGFSAENASAQNTIPTVGAAGQITNPTAISEGELIPPAQSVQPTDIPLPDTQTPAERPEETLDETPDEALDGTPNETPTATIDEMSAVSESGQAWTPIGKPWLVALFDVDASESIVESGGRVSKWQDLSGNDRHATQSDDTRQPILSTSDSRIGGLRSISSAEEGLHSGLIVPEVSFRRLFASLQYKSGSETTFIGGFHSLFSATGASANRWRAVGYLGQNRLFKESLAFDLSPSKNGANEKNQLLPLPLSVVVLDHGSTVRQSLAIAHEPDGPPAWTWPGPYRRILLTDGSESPGDIERIEGWMAHRDKLQSMLPADHPYRSSAPLANGNKDQRREPAGYVVHLIGQSNAGGRAPGPSLRQNINGMRLPNGILLSDSTSPTDAPGTYGVDMVLAETWSLEQAPVLLKTTRGGVPVDYYRYQLLDKHLGILDSFQAPQGFVHVALWVQGESDALADPQTWQNYQASERAVFDALQSKVPGIRIFSVLLNEDWNYTNNVTLSQGIESVNSAKRINADTDENVTVIGGYYSFQADHVHYDAAGFEQMAYDFVQSINRD